LQYLLHAVDEHPEVLADRDQRRVLVVKLHAQRSVHVCQTSATAAAASSLILSASTIVTRGATPTGLARASPCLNKLLLPLLSAHGLKLGVPSPHQRATFISQTRCRSRTDGSSGWQTRRRTPTMASPCSIFSTAPCASSSVTSCFLDRLGLSETEKDD
jgi:hypothetical protein